MRARELVSEAFDQAKPLDLRAERTFRIAAVATLSIVLVGVAIIWALSIRNLDLLKMNDLGLVSVLPPGYFIALAVLTVSFGFAVNNRSMPAWILLAHVVMLVLIIHGTPSLTYGTLRYSWAWKHIGVVNYILAHGAIDQNATYLSGMRAYHNWPGFFALGALLTGAAGFDSPLQFAPLAPIFFNLAFAGAVYMLLGAFHRDQRLKWLAVWLFILGNWIGQDYFAPQALTYFLGLIIVGVCLTWFSARARTAGVGPSTGISGRLERFWARLEGTEETSSLLGKRSTAAQRVGVMAIAILAFAAVATSHQLTPFVIVLAVGMLVLGYRTTARSLPILLGVIAAAWAIYAAWLFTGDNLFWILQSVGQLFSNSAVTDLSKLSPGQVVVSRMSLGLSGAMALLGAVGFVRRWRQGRRDLSYVLLGAAPFPLLVATSYGGEMNLRVYFFALPYIAFFAAALFYPTTTSGRSWRTSLSIILVSVVLLGGLLVAYDGRERMNYFTQDEVEASTYLFDHIPVGSLVISGSYNYPAAFERTDEYTSLSLDGAQIESRRLRTSLASDPVQAVTDLMKSPNYPATYLIITRSQKVFLEMRPVLPEGTLDRIEQGLKQSSQFKIIYQNRDAEVFTLVNQPDLPGAAR